jgi:Protein of unknown function (DUF1488)
MLVQALDHRNSDAARGAIGFWMIVEGESPVRPVRVFVNYEALADIDPQQVRDLDGALTTFDNNRDRIDMAANCRFDAGEVELDLHEGQPLIILRTEDFEGGVTFL